jgi:hypothetical protein
MFSLKIVQGFYLWVLFIISLSENSVGVLYDIKPVGHASSLDYENTLMQILLEVKTEVSLLTKEIKELKEIKMGKYKLISCAIPIISPVLCLDKNMPIQKAHLNQKTKR